MASALVRGSPVQLATMGIVGSLNARLFMASSNPTLAGSMRPEWNAPPTRSGTTFLAPRADARSRACATAIRSPLMTICSAVLTFDTYVPVSLAISSRVISSRPMIAAIVPGFWSHAACMSLLRTLTRYAVSATVSTPAAVSAVYSPRLWPAISTGRGIASAPSFSSIALMQARLTAMMAGCALTVCLRSSSGPLNRVSVSDLPSASSTSSKIALAAGDSLYSSRPIPTACAPWPGNRYATAESWPFGMNVSVMASS